MTLNELLLEWSYRTQKGYPSLDNPSDVRVLRTLLEKLNLPSDTIINRMSEASLNPGELRKDREPNRAEVFLKKIENDEEFELMDGSMVVIDKEQSADSIQKLKNKDFNKLIFTDTSGKQLKLNQFKKTAEFGAGSGAGGGSVDTRIMESAHCFGLGIAYYVKGEKITKEDLIRENFEQAQSHVDVDATIDEVEEFLERKPLWYDSTAKSVNKIYDLFPNNSFKFHRGSEQVKAIYSAWQTAKKTEGLKLMDDKWNPADIWLISPKISSVTFSNDLKILNGEISNFYEDRDLVGISLKMIGKKAEATSKVFGDPNIPPGNEYKYEGYKTTTKSSTVEIQYTGGSITCRNFSVETGWSTEIKGKAAQGGKCGHTGVNDILKLNNITQLPLQRDTLAAFRTDDKEYYDKFYYLFDRFVENINDKDFKKLYNDKPLSWKTSNYMGLEFLSRLEDNPEQTDEILNDVMRYASSSTKLSSQFIKIS
jgi:hypothetical protein